jgi:hypothetical protein
LEEVEEAWPHILETMQEAYPPDVAYFRDIRPIRVEQDGILLELPAAGVFLLELLEDSTRRERVTGAFARVLSRPVHLRLVLAEGPSAAAPRQGAGVRPAREVLSDPAVQKILDRFKGEVLNIE